MKENNQLNEDIVLTNKSDEDSLEGNLIEELERVQC